MSVRCRVCEEVWCLRHPDPRPCKGINSNVCVGEGCYGEACIKPREPRR